MTHSLVANFDSPFCVQSLKRNLMVEVTQLAGWILVEIGSVFEPEGNESNLQL